MENEVSRISAIPNIPPLSVYLMLPTGGVGVVRDLIVGNHAPSTGANSSNASLPALLHKALAQVPEVRPGNENLLYVRAETTDKGLTAIANHLAESPERKALLWITYGTPSSIRFRGEGDHDLTPQRIPLFTPQIQART